VGRDASFKFVKSFPVLVWRKCVPMEGDDAKSRSAYQGCSRAA